MFIEQLVINITKRVTHGAEMQKKEKERKFMDKENKK